ncbi:MAG: ABC transporter permease subunit [Chloroflexales bacterium]|nr:ABC transporter permease subunit [Chloroflexales bacterium]
MSKLPRAGRLTRQLVPWVIPAALLIVWEVLSRVGVISPRTLPAPSAVVGATITLITTEQLLHDIAVSFQRAFVGFLIGGGVGFALGLLNGVSTISEGLLDSSIQMIRNIPHLAIIPLVILWFGIGETAKLFLVALGVFFPVYINTFYGIRGVEPGLLEMGRVYGLSRLALFWQIILPGALPSILVGLRYALGIMWLTLIVAETIAADSGIGEVTMSAREFMRTDVVVMGILLYALLGKLADSIARLLEGRLLQWHPSYQPK